MATPKQIELRIKYAKTSINSLTKKVGIYKNKVKKLEGDMKKANAQNQQKKLRPKKRSPKRNNYFLCVFNEAPRMRALNQI
jgi:hypothetical protein